MGASDRVHEVVQGDGYAVGDIAAMGEGYGFRKIRRALEVTAFGINAIVMPGAWESGAHYHDLQEEVYFVHAGEIEIEFGDGSRHVLGPGGVARVDPGTVRRVRNPGAGEAIYLVAGGKDGYVPRDGRLADGRSADGQHATRHGQGVRGGEELTVPGSPGSAPGRTD